MASYNFEKGDGSGRFKAPHRQSVFSAGAEFTIKNAVCGVYKREDGTVINKDGANSIRLETSLSPAEDDLLNINRLLTKRKVVYNDSGRALLLYDCEFHEELSGFLLKEVGLDPTDKRFFAKNASEIGKILVEQFFNGKTLVCKKVENVFFKTVKDGVEKLEAPYDDIVVIGWKQS